MADRLIRAIGVGLALCVLVPGAHAQMADPTRPPVGVLDAAGEGGATSGPVLQSALIPKRGKPLAVISGRQVRLGERYGESRLVKLTEREAVLEGPDGVERLRLTPGVEKTDVSTVTNRTRKLPAPKPAQGEGRP